MEITYYTDPCDGAGRGGWTVGGDVDVPEPYRRWQGVPDDANGIGLFTYQVWRGESFLGAVKTPEFSDDGALQTGTLYTYTIRAMDFHGNSADTTVSVSTAPAGTVDARRVGVRPDGAYWGAMGENIDMQSGNLNFTLPLLTAQGRTGWKVPVSLTYNSQNWRKDTNGALWNLGRDVGYGYGW